MRAHQFKNSNTIMKLAKPIKDKKKNLKSHKRKITKNSIYTKKSNITSLYKTINS